MFNRYMMMFPDADVPNYWECGTWGEVEYQLKKALLNGKPWVSKTPKGVIL